MNDKSKFEITREHLKIATVATAAAALAFVIGRCVEKVCIAKDLIKVVVF